MNSIVVACVLWVSAIALLCRALKFREGRSSFGIFTGGIFVLILGWVAINTDLEFRHNVAHVSVSAMTRVDNATIGDGVALYLVSQARFSGGRKCGGIIQSDSLKNLGPGTQNILKNPRAGMALFWLTDMTASNGEITGDLIFFHDARQAAPGIWIGWISEPISRRVRSMDLSVID